MALGLKNGRTLGLFMVAALASVHASAQIVGFTPASYTLNTNATGNPAISSNVLTLTDNLGNEARSAFFNKKQDITHFTAQFTYQPSGSVGGVSAANGATFTIQNAGLTSLGLPDNGLGYSGMGTSFAYEMNIYSPDTIGTTVHINGATGTYATTGAVDISIGDAIQVNLQYSPGNLLETLTDLTTTLTFTRSYAVDIPGAVGGTTAYVGFTGGTGGSTSTQTISSFTYKPTPEPGTLTLLSGLGLSGSIFLKRRRRKAC